MCNSNKYKYDMPINDCVNVIACPGTGPTTPQVIATPSRRLNQAYQFGSIPGEERIDITRQVNSYMPDHTKRIE